MHGSSTNCLLKTSQSGALTSQLCAVGRQEMDPASQGFQRIFANPMAFAAFKSTEPWLLEYVALDLPAALEAAGFDSILTSSSTPRHFTLIARKPRELRG